MPPKRIDVTLTQKEQDTLHTFVGQGHRSAREINRARILLLSNQCMKDQDISKLLGLSRGTIYNMRKKYNNTERQHILDVLKDEPRSGRPIKLDSKVEANVTMIACSQPPEGACRWTLHLIADKLVKLHVLDTVSHESVRSILKKANSNPG